MRYRITQFHPVIIINHTIPIHILPFHITSLYRQSFLLFGIRQFSPSFRAIKHFGICSIFRISGSVYQIAWNLTLTLINTKRFKGVNHTIFLSFLITTYPLSFIGTICQLASRINLIGILHIIRQSIVR
jgi:hypothetical protein